jgi:hypothetical protein
MQQHPVSDVALATPPTATSTASLLGLPVADWVLWLNLLYIIILIAFKLWGKWKEYHLGRK